LAAYAAKEYFFRAAFSTILLRKIVENAALKNLILPPQAAKYFLHNLIIFFWIDMGLCKKPPARHLAAYAAKEYFFRARILLILLCKINKIRALKNFILPPQAAKYFYTTS